MELCGIERDTSEPEMEVINGTFGCYRNSLELEGVPPGTFSSMPAEISQPRTSVPRLSLVCPSSFRVVFLHRLPTEESDQKLPHLCGKEQPSAEGFGIVFIYMIISHQLQYTYLYTTRTQLIQVLKCFFLLT